MSGNQVVIMKIRTRRMTLPRDGRHRRLSMEQLEYRWLLSGAASGTDWPTAATAIDHATTVPTKAATAVSAAKWPEACAECRNRNNAAGGRIGCRPRDIAAGCRHCRVLAGRRFERRLRRPRRLG